MSTTLAPPRAVPSPNGNAATPPADSLDDFLDGDIEIVERWHTRKRQHVYFRPMDVAQKRAWLKEIITEDGDGKQTVAPDHMERAIALCWVRKDGTPMVQEESDRGKLTRMHPLSFAEMWEHVAALNALRDKDSETLKNDSAGNTGSATSPESPATTA